MKFLRIIKTLFMCGVLFGLSGCEQNKHSSLPLGPQPSQAEKNEIVEMIAGTNFIFSYTCHQGDCHSNDNQTTSVIDEFDVTIGDSDQLTSSQATAFALNLTLPEQSFTCDGDCDWSIISLGTTIVLSINNLVVDGKNETEHDHLHILHATFITPTINDGNIKIYFDITHKDSSLAPMTAHRTTHGGGIGI